MFFVFPMPVNVFPYCPGLRQDNVESVYAIYRERIDNPVLGRFTMPIKLVWIGIQAMAAQELENVGDVIILNK
jgi:hypothetical protein